MPRTKIGQASFWATATAFAMIHINYWLSMAIKEESQSFWFRVALPGFLMGLVVIAGGISSILAIIKYRDKSILLMLTSLIGLLGILFAAGEILFPH